MSVNSDEYGTGKFTFYYRDEKSMAKDTSVAWTGDFKLDYTSPVVKSSSCYMIVNMKSSNLLLDKVRLYTKEPATSKIVIYHNDHNLSGQFCSTWSDANIAACRSGNAAITKIEFTRVNDWWWELDMNSRFRGFHWDGISSDWVIEVLNASDDSCTKSTSNLFELTAATFVPALYAIKGQASSFDIASSNRAGMVFEQSSRAKNGGS